MTDHLNNHHTAITMETRGGRVFHYQGDSLDDININDIASALSKCCRFVGHCRRFYSVAEHSYYASYQVPPAYAYAALLHDASEAYLSDIASPIKRQMPEYKVIEEGLMDRIAKRFELEPKFWHDPIIKRADMEMLKTEAYQLFDSKGAGWGIPEDLEMYPHVLTCYNPDAAEMLFLRRFEELDREREMIYDLENK